MAKSKMISNYILVPPKTRLKRNIARIGKSRLLITLASAKTVLKILQQVHNIKKSSKTATSWKAYYTECSLMS